MRKCLWCGNEFGGQGFGRTGAFCDYECLKNYAIDAKQAIKRGAHKQALEEHKQAFIRRRKLGWKSPDTVKPKREGWISVKKEEN